MPSDVAARGVFYASALLADRRVFALAGIARGSCLILGGIGLGRAGVQLSVGLGLGVELRLGTVGIAVWSDAAFAEIGIAVWSGATLAAVWSSLLVELRPISGDRGILGDWSVGVSVRSRAGIGLRGYCNVGPTVVGRGLLIPAFRSIST